MAVYVGKKACGCVVAAMGTTTLDAKGTKAAVGAWLEGGLEIHNISEEEARDMGFGCFCGQQSMFPEENTGEVVIKHQPYTVRNEGMSAAQRDMDAVVIAQAKQEDLPF